MGDLAMHVRTKVFIHAADPVTEAGVAAQLRGRPEVELADIDRAAVAVVACDTIDAATTTAIKAIQRNGCPRVLVVAAQLDEHGLVAAIEAGAIGFLRRAEAVPERLASAIEGAAQGDGSVPPDLLGRLMDQVGQLQRQVLRPRGIAFNGLTEREIEVLRLIAEGMDTTEIAETLCYSPRTVKNVIHDVTTRLQLRNRSHAVAHAVREGLI
jgi:DNA-binding NarL/FixJ family response regulator